MSIEEIEQKEIKIDKYRIVLPKKWREELGIDKETLIQELFQIGKNQIEFRKAQELKEPMKLPTKAVSVFGSIDDIGRIKISSEIRKMFDLNDENYKYLLKKTKGMILLIKKRNDKDD
ncbi:MAG: hypothetical protein ACTSRG_02470 [Candidatus Helarchaeota archaeon]